MPPSLAPIDEFPVSDLEAVRQELRNAGRPLVLRGLAAAWPSVQLAARSAGELIGYLRRLDNGTPVEAIMTPPEVRGRIFYSEGLAGFNFVRNRLPLSGIAEQLLRYAHFAHPPSVAVQSALTRDCLPRFAAENPLPLLDAAVLPRIWFGNAITTPIHLDEWHNIGCVVCGQRRFTLFPPREVANLYVGPLDFAPTGAPMSLVQLQAPDLVRFPRFREALAAARSAELGPGDAIFIPALWWHHVESLEPVNVLINYWWHAAGGPVNAAVSGFDALLHSILNVRSLPPATRDAWRALFEHYVFGESQAATAHLPPTRQGALGPLTSDAGQLRADLAQRLKTPK